MTARRATYRFGDPRPTAPVDRRLLLATETVQVRDNRCARVDPSPSPPTEPMARCEVVFPSSGLWVRRVSGRELAVEPNTVHFVNEGEVHCVHHPAGCGDRNTGISLERSALEEIAASHAESAFDRKRGAFRIYSRTARDPELSAHLMLLRALHDGDTDAMAIEETALRLVAAAITGGRPTAGADRSRPDTARAHRAIVLRVIVEIERRLAHSLTLARLARHAATSPYHMARVFRACTGLSVHAHLRRRRVAAAAHDLLSTDLSPSAISDRAGFADSPHLCRTFRRMLGTTPHLFRRLPRSEALRRVDELLPEVKAGRG